MPYGSPYPLSQLWFFILYSPQSDGRWHQMDCLPSHTLARFLTLTRRTAQFFLSNFIQINPKLLSSYPNHQQIPRPKYQKTPTLILINPYQNLISGRWSHPYVSVTPNPGLERDPGSVPPGGVGVGTITKTHRNVATPELRRRQCLEHEILRRNDVHSPKPKVVTVTRTLGRISHVPPPNQSS